MVRYFVDRVLVMYLGRIVESADHVSLWRDPKHPYTRALLAAVPSRDPARRASAALKGEISMVVQPGGCRFRARCPLAIDRCASEDPPLRRLSDKQMVACHLA